MFCDFYNMNITQLIADKSRPMLDPFVSHRFLLD